MKMIKVWFRIRAYRMDDTGNDLFLHEWDEPINADYLRIVNALGGGFCALTHAENLEVILSLSDSAVFKETLVWFMEILVKHIPSKFEIDGKIYTPTEPMVMVSMNKENPYIHLSGIRSSCGIHPVRVQAGGPAVFLSTGNLPDGRMHNNLPG